MTAIARPEVDQLDEPVDTSSIGPLWLSHHYACDAGRCVRIGHRFLCRRCLAMFAGFIPAVVLLTSAWADDLQAGDFGLVLALTIVAGIEFVQVARRRTPYSARRVLVLSPFPGAVLAWLGVHGARDGLGPAHLAFGVVGFAVLAVLLASGQLVRRRA